MAGSTRVPRERLRLDHESGDQLVSRPVRIAAAWSWRWLVIVLATLPIIWIISRGAIILVPLLVALLFTALLVPLTNKLTNDFRWPKGVALIVALLALFSGIAALVFLAIAAFRSGNQFDTADIERRWGEFLVWLESTPLDLNQEIIDEWMGELLTWLQANAGTLIESTVSAGTTVAAVLTGSVFTLFAIIFYLLDGRRIWLFFVSLFPRAARAAVDGAGERAWISTGHYVRVQVVVALIDAIGIFVGALILQVPYALAIGIIVFLGAFVPLIGTFLSGAVAVIIALIANGFWNAIVMLIVVVAVMAIEANVLQPLIMGQAVQLHPLAVLTSVAGGSIVAGIGGAVFAVPVVAAVNVIVKYVSSNRWRGEPDPTQKPGGYDVEEDPVPVRTPLITRRKTRNKKETPA